MTADIASRPPEEAADISAFSDAMRSGLRMVADLERSSQSLDVLLLTGRPHAIADAARAMELSLAAAEPVFRRIASALGEIGVARLQDAGERLRRSDEAQAAAAADRLRTALKRFVRLNESRRRRAQGLDRGLSASLRTLHAFGLAGNGRLIAEA
jgi:hypothetical protein